MGYKIGRVYRITKNDDPTINYVGSTFSQLKVRWSEHKNKKKNHCSIRKYLDKYGADNFKIILIKEYLVYADNQKDTKHLRAYEQLWINKFKLKKCCINMKGTIEYLKLQRNRTRAKSYYEKNKNKVDCYRKEWTKRNLEHIKQYKKENRIKNSEHIKKRDKEYYEKNKDRLKEKIECPICNSLIARYNLNGHQKTKKCINASK